MRRDSLLRSTPLRLAMVFALIFIATFALAGFVAFDLVKAELNRRYDLQISQMFDVLSKTYAESDIQDLVEATKVHIATNQDNENIFLLQAADGRVLVANIPKLQTPDGWSRVRGSRIGLDDDNSYRIFAGKVGDNRLVVGTSDEQTTDIEEIVLASLGWAAIVVMSLAVAGGLLLGTRVKLRLAAVRETMDRVAHGQLDARIPLIGRGDDLDRLGADVNAALAQLSDLVVGMRQVSTDIAHDLKTPLNRLRIVIEKAIDGHAKRRSIGKELSVAREECDRINETFDALLSIAQIESGARKSRFVGLDLFDVIANVADTYHDVAEDAGDELTFSCTSDVPFNITGDRELLTQLFANLMENAIRHCPKGTRIHCELRVNRASIVATVADNGGGIPLNERDNVFRRLYRLEKSRTSPGSGLGMSLVRAIAELHDAVVRLEDNEPGVRVIVTFPVSTVQSQPFWIGGRDT